MFLVDLGNFPGDGAKPSGTENVRHLFQGPDEAVRRLVEDQRPRFRGQGVQQGLPPLLLRQEPFEAEPVAGQSGTDQGRDAGRRPGQRLDLDPLLRAGADQKETRVRNAGCAGIGDQCDIQAGEELFLDKGDGLVLIVFMVGLEAAADVVVLEQDGARARVLREDQVGLPEHLDGAEGHVLEVADRGRNDVQAAGHPPIRVSCGWPS